MSRASILYAEDHATVRLAVRDRLVLEGWTVEACCDGRAALGRLLSDAHYDLLLLDDEMPGPSGIELTKRARTLAHRRDIPIVIISASECEHEARRAGADLFLRKPDDVGSLVAAVASLLERRGVR
ncbi:MAG TPA: response regulator [Pyrinomonadaceae bacterium]|nr:response regulator [Pyrinomonadaceae bacterium]